MIPGPDFQALRKERGFPSAQSLADASGVSREILAQYESGRRASLTLEQVVTLCDVLKVTPYVLVPEFDRNDTLRMVIREELRAELMQRLANDA